MSLADAIRARFAASIDIPAILSGDTSAPVAGLTPAAVLVAIVDRPEPTLLLTTRNEALRAHPGQVAFPGGRADPADGGAVTTALREAEEEIALPPDAVTVIGLDTPYRTGTGFSITPVLGIIPPDLPLIAREFEVADIFEVPLAHLLDPANHHEQQGEWMGVNRHFYEILWGDRRIWGATAAMIVNLERRLRA